MDEPESIGALSLAAREGLDNLTFVVNCNLQRLDGPVRGNGKIIQELEALFRGAGWNVIKVIWAREWDDLLARDKDGVLLAKMNDTLDGDYQRMAVSDGATIREQFFGPDPAPARAGRAPLRRRARQAAPRRPRLPQGLRGLRRGGRAQGRADRDPGQDGQGLDARPRHRGPQRHAPGQEADRRRAQDLPRPPRAADPRRQAQGRAVLPPRPRCARDPVHARAPARSSADRSRGAWWCRSRCRRRRTTVFSEFFAGSDRPASTTMAFSRLVRNLVRDPQIGTRIVPIIPDEARTFGMDPLFKEVGIYNPLGQRYTPVDKELLLSYIEKKDGQLLEEGITEAGSMGSFQAAGTAYATLARADGPVLHVLLDVRHAAHRRPGVGLRRRARPRLHDGRHRRPHDADRRGAPARRRALARAGQHRPEHPRLRPGLRLRAGDHRARGDRPHVRRARRGRLLLRHPLQRELADAGEAGGRRGGRAARPVPVQRAPEGGERRVQILASGPILLQALRAQRHAARALRRRRRHLERHELPAAAQRGARRRALEPPPSRRRAAGRRTCASASIRPTDRSSPPRTT